MIAKKLLIVHKESWHIKYMVHTDDLDKIREIIDEVDVLVVCPRIEKQLKSKLVTFPPGEKKVYIIPELYEIMMVKSKLTHFDDMPGLRSSSSSYPGGTISKEDLDILISSILIVISLPLMIISALLVKVSSKGPVLYKQERLTINNKPFNLYKFRTMINDARKIRTGPGY